MSYAYPPPPLLPSSSSPTTSTTNTSKTVPLASTSERQQSSTSSGRSPPPPLHDINTIPDPSSSTVPAPTEPPPSPLTEPGAWFSYPLSYAANSLYRRVSAPPDPRLTGLLQTPGASQPRYPSPGPSAAGGGSSSSSTSMIFSRSRSRQRQQEKERLSRQSSAAPPPLPGQAALLVQPPVRTASPFQPPPLTALQLAGFRTSTPAKDRILSTALAEEIRLLVPPRLQLVHEWQLAYSVEQDGASLATLYNKCGGEGGGGDGGGGSGFGGGDGHRSGRLGYVVAVRDALGGICGAFLTDPPRPSSSYYGTGECFLWSASIQTVDKILAHLPPPPSEDTTHMESRNTTLMSPTKTAFDVDLLGDDPPPELNNGNGNGVGSSGRGGTGGAAAAAAAAQQSKPSISTNGSSKPNAAVTEEEERIRFRAFPYSGVNDYMIYCEHEYMSVGGGDGKYGLWLDDRLEQGVSSPSLTFGNECLSEEGEKFEALGVEVWFIGG